MKTTRSKTALSPRKPTAQKRSAQTVKDILQAAARVLSKESLSAFNTNRIAEVAGVSIGSLYQYFPNKDSIMVKLIEQQQQNLASNVERIALDLRGKTFENGLRACIKMAMQHQHAEPALASAIDHEERRLEVSTILRDAQQRMCQSFAVWLKSHFPTMRKSRLELASMDCFLIIKAIVDQPSPGPMQAARALAATSGYLRTFLS